MNIVQALNKIKNDILSFVTLNLSTKADKNHEHEIDVAFSESSTNPIQNRIVSAAINNLNGLVGSESVESQINAVASLKQDTITGAATSIITDNLIKEAVLVSDGDGKVAASIITASELNCLDGITSNIQTQLLNKASNSHTHPIDSELNVESTNPVQNKVVAEALNGKMSCELIWELLGEDLDGFSFEPQAFSTSKNISEYDYLLVEKGADGVYDGATPIASFTPSCDIMQVTDGGSYYLTVITDVFNRRALNISTSENGVSEIHFGEGHKYNTYGSTPTVDNYVCIPLRIYGLKIN